MKKFLLLILLCSLSSCVLINSVESAEDTNAKEISAKVELIGLFDTKIASESSGLAKASTVEDTFFTHGDSFNSSSIQTIKLGEDQIIVEDKDVKGPINFDWEDLASDSMGNIFIADIGDNLKFRTNRTVYVVDEDSLLTNSSVPVKDKFTFSFKNLDGKTVYTDCEAVYYDDNKLTFLSKEEYATSIFELDMFVDDNAYFVKSILVDGRVTSADIFHDDKSVAILTYTKLYILNEMGMSYINIDIAQCEAVCFGNSSNELYITNESGELFKVTLYSEL